MSWDKTLTTKAYQDLYLDLQNGMQHPWTTGCLYNKYVLIYKAKSRTINDYGKRGNGDAIYNKNSNSLHGRLWQQILIIPNKILATMVSFDM